MTDPVGRHWSQDVPAVKKALKFIKGKGAVTAQQLVEWDQIHGRKLFLWNDPQAAQEYRLEQARHFLNSFRQKLEGMRVRAFIHVREDEQAGIMQAAYYRVQDIAAHPAMREQVVNNIMRHLEQVASELKMWKLGTAEREALFHRLAQAMGEEP